MLVVECSNLILKAMASFKKIADTAIGFIYPNVCQLCGAQPAGGTRPAAVAPVVPLRAVAEIAGVGIFDQHVEQWVSPDLVRQREGLLGDERES